jgi:glycosyltransferase involved in cell wall biosynthesis
MKILYDGWSLVHQPNSPAALHLLTLLAAHPADFPAWVGLPGEAFHPLPQGIESLRQPAANSDWGRLNWEQRLLPAQAGRIEASLVHLVGSGPALFGSRRALVSPAGFAESELSGARRRPGFAARLSESLSAGSQARVDARLWPADLPPSQANRPVHLLPPAVHPYFHPASEVPGVKSVDGRELDALDLPETYLLAHGPGDEPALRRLLDAWSWAAGSIGAYYPLVMAGLGRAGQDRLAALLAEYQLTGTAFPLPPLSLPALAAVYQRCSALFHPAPPSPWGDPIRLALACGKPVVALEDERSAVLVGPAGYLIPGGDDYPALCRALGAALITVVVEAGLAEALAEAAQRRAAAWQWGSFVDGLRECYAALAG